MCSSLSLPSHRLLFLCVPSSACREVCLLISLSQWWSVEIISEIEKNHKSWASTSTPLKKTDFVATRFHGYRIGSAYDEFLQSSFPPSALFPCFEVPPKLVHHQYRQKPKWLVAFHLESRSSLCLLFAVFLCSLISVFLLFFLCLLFICLLLICLLFICVLYICLSLICLLFICLSNVFLFPLYVSLYLYQSVCVAASLPVCLSVWLCISMSVYIYLCLSMSVCILFFSILFFYSVGLVC